MVQRRGGSGFGFRLRRMSHISSVGSRFFSVIWLSIQRCPHKPMPRMTGRRSSPARVSRYSVTPLAFGIVATIPAASNSFKRLDRRAGDMRGTPRRNSLNRLLPHSISRTISAVQREQISSAAMATGQNWP
jgi:hypothetical protein